MRLFVVFALVLIWPSKAPAQAPVRDFYNVLFPGGADPWIYQHTDKRYYATVSTQTNVTLWRSETLSGLGGGEQKVVWTPVPGSPNSKEIWAPEIHFLQGKWYIYYAADNGDNVNHKLYVLENDSADPFEGKFIEKGRIYDRNADRWAIDGTVIETGGKLYFAWSGWEGFENVSQILYIAPMINPWTIGDRVEISRPTHDWEKRGAPPAINEGPQVLFRGQSIHLVYSAAGSWTDDYCLGLLTAKLGADLLNPATWRKHPEPVFKSGNGILAPGHCCFAKSLDGKEDWIVYHAARYPGAGWNRFIRAQPFTWNDDETPRLGAPVPANAPIPLPSGETERLRYEAEAAMLLGGARITKQSGTSGGGKVSDINAPDSYLEFPVQSKDVGIYNLAVRFANDSPRKRSATHQLWINGKSQPMVQYEHIGPNNWSNVVIRVELAAGLNKIRFGKGNGVVELDCVDVFPCKAAKP